MSEKHLWEYDHPYYCDEGDYDEQFVSWQAFIDEMGNADKDLNLLFRWDWKQDEYYDNVLLLYFIQQRKGRLVSFRVAMQNEDEENVKQYLLPHKQHMDALWLPIKVDDHD